MKNKRIYCFLSLCYIFLSCSVINKPCLCVLVSVEFVALLVRMLKKELVFLFPVVIVQSSWEQHIFHVASCLTKRAMQ